MLLGQKRGLVIASVIVFGVMACAGCGTPLRFPLTAGASFEFSAYYQNDVSGSIKPIMSAHRDLLRTIYPLWYQVDAAGNILDTGYDDDAKRLADAAGTAVVPVVQAAGPGGGAAAVLHNQAAADSAVSKLAELVRTRDFHGLALDFGNLPADAGKELLNFTRSLWRAMHGLGKRLVITVPAYPDNQTAATAYDYRQLSRVADFVILSAYDLHNDLTPAGPVAPLDWVDRSISRATAVIPASKLILAVGAYGYDWPAGGPGLATSVSAAGAYQLASQVQQGVTYDASAHESTFAYTQSSEARVVWFGDRRSAAERIALARKRGLYGVVYWRLGQEEPGFWGAAQGAAQGK